jgi:hypothetical protein
MMEKRSPSPAKAPALFNEARIAYAARGLARRHGLLIVATYAAFIVTVLAMTNGPAGRSRAAGDHV